MPPSPTPRPLPLLGVLGGMGPLATVDFLRKLIDATPAARDQDHLPVLASSIPQIPDRAAAFRGEGASPLPALLACGSRLVAGGAAALVMPCNTAHLWFDAVQHALGVPMLHVVDAALAELPAGGGPVGLLGTDATLAAGLYARRAPGVQWLQPDAALVASAVMPGIRAVKSGDLALGRRELARAARRLVARGARVLVLACTEIPLVLDARAAGAPVLDATAALARASVRWAQQQQQQEQQALPA